MAIAPPVVREARRNTDEAGGNIRNENVANSKLAGTRNQNEPLSISNPRRGGNNSNPMWRP